MGRLLVLPNEKAAAPGQRDGQILALTATLGTHSDDQIHLDGVQFKVR